MEKYRPPYSITNAMLARVASVSEKLGRIGALHSPGATYTFSPTKTE